MQAASALSNAGPEGTGRPLPAALAVGAADPVRPPQPTGRDTRHNRDDPERRQSALGAPGRREATPDARDEAPVPSVHGPVVSRALVVEGRPMSMVDVTAESGRVATRRTEFETRVLANDPEQAADASLARFPPLKHNRFRPAGAELINPALPAPPVGSPAEIGRRMFLLPPAAPARLATDSPAA